jgi:hypothetical protein
MITDDLAVEWGEKLIGYGFAENTELWTVLPNMQRFPDIRNPEVQSSVLDWFQAISGHRIKIKNIDFSVKRISRWFKTTTQGDQ